MQAKKYFTSKAAFRSGPSANGPLLRRTGRRCGDMRMLLHKCILRIKGHSTVLAAIGAIRKHQARLCRVPQLRI